MGEYWRTTSVTALPPGWRNVFQTPGERAEVLACPALLLQELIDNDPYSGPERTEFVRVVAAADNDGEFRPAFDVKSWVCTLGPGEEIEPTPDDS